MSLGLLIGIDSSELFDAGRFFGHPNLYRHYIQLLAGFFTDHMFAAAEGTCQFVFGQFVDDFDTRQISR